MTRPPRTETWEEGIRRFSEESAGAFFVHVVERGDLPGLLADALAGDADAERLAGLVQGTLERIAAAPRHKPMLCACCPCAVKGGPFAVVVAMPARDDATRGVALAVCGSCASGRDAVQAAALAALRKLWPDLRPIDINAAEGRA